MFNLILRVSVFVFLFISCFIPAQAENIEYLYPGTLITKNDRAFFIKYESENNYSLKVYTFPDLVELKNIDLSSNYSYSTLHDLGISIYSMDYEDAKNEDPSNPNLWTTKVTTNITTYDLNLNTKGNLKSIDSYTWELSMSDPEYLDIKKQNKKRNKSQCVFKKLKNGKLLLVK